MLNITKQCFPEYNAKQSKYTAEHLNNAMLLGGVFNVNVFGGMNSVRFARKEIKRYKEITENIEMFSGEWKRLTIEKMSDDAIMKNFESEVMRSVTIMRENGIYPEKWDLAIDMHLIPRYDKTHGEELMNSKPKNGTDTFERYITIQSLIPGARLVMGSLPMPDMTEKSDYVRMLLEKCNDCGIDIGIVMADREFFTVNVIKVFEELGIRYLISCRNTFGVINGISEFVNHNRQSTSDMLLENNTDRVHYTSKITVRKKRRKVKGKYVDENIDSFEYDPEEPPHKQYIAFATNDPTIDVEEYARRWGIETGYRQIEAARPRTRSKNHIVRTFHFLYAVMLYNIWAMINYLHVARMGIFEVWDGEPLVTQLNMKMCILLYALFKTPHKPPPKEHIIEIIKT